MRAEIVPGVTADPKVAFGKPVIAGTRTPVAVVLGQLAAGPSEQEVCAEHDLTKLQIRAALRYGAWLGGPPDVSSAAAAATARASLASRFCLPTSYPLARRRLRGR
jgi:uncharacterized protein (DUF433 family)